MLVMNCGLGVFLLLDNLETQQQQVAIVPHPQHLLDKPTGNKFLVEVFILEQSRLMEPYGCGVLVLLEDLETE